MSATTEPTVLVDVDERIATLTLHRPAARNALNRQLRRELWTAVRDLDASGEVDVIVLTGSDPAFCAGLDLRELAATASGGDDSDDADTGGDTDPGPDDPAAGPTLEAPVRFLPVVDTPIIGAINGAAITGGFEVALQCSFLVASERAVFADTHARVGILPGAGLTPFLVEAVGVRRALELSLTGNFLDARTAYELGLVNKVVPHEDLLPTARAIAADIASNDRAAVRALVAHYRAMLDEPTLQARFDREAEMHRSFGGLNDPSDRVDAVIERGRIQQR